MQAPAGYQVAGVYCAALGQRVDAAQRLAALDRIEEQRNVRLEHLREPPGAPTAAGATALLVDAFHQYGNGVAELLECGIALTSGGICDAEKTAHLRRLKARAAETPLFALDHLLQERNSLIGSAEAHHGQAPCEIADAELLLQQRIALHAFVHQLELRIGFLPALLSRECSAQARARSHHRLCLRNGARALEYRERLLREDDAFLTSSLLEEKLRQLAHCYTDGHRIAPAAFQRDTQRLAHDRLRFCDTPERRQGEGVRSLKIE